MKVFMNSEGKYLTWHRSEKGGFSSGSHWVYEWVDSIHSATVALSIPRNRNDEWRDGNPSKQVVVELEATLETTRVVTLIKKEISND